MNMMTYLGWTGIGLGAIWLPVIMKRPGWIVAEGFCGLLYRHGKLLHRISPGEHRFWRDGYSVKFVDMRPTILEMTVENPSRGDSVSTNISVELTYQIIQAETVVQRVPDYCGYLEQAIRNAMRPALVEISNYERQGKCRDLEQQLFEQVTRDADRMGILVNQFRITEVVFRKQIKAAPFHLVA